MSSAEFITETESVPQGYDSYTMLLIPESLWDTKLLPLEKVFHRFHALGLAIGKNNLAFWFYHAACLTAPKLGVQVEAIVSDPNVSYNEIISRNDIELYTSFTMHYDRERARRYCDHYSLNYNDGPYIIHTENHPNNTKTPDVVLKLKGLDFRHYITLINNLEQALRTNRNGVNTLRAQSILLRWGATLKSLKGDIFKTVELSSDLINPS